MIRASLATVTVLLGAAVLVQGYTASWEHAWLMALTFATGVMAGLLASLAILWERLPDDSKLSNGETHDEGQDA